jgi:hypothetical protein
MRAPLHAVAKGTSSSTMNAPPPLLAACVAPVAAIGCVAPPAGPQPGRPADQAAARPPPPAPAAAQIWGVTLDNVDAHLPATIAALAHLAVRPTARIVFDPGRAPATYAAAVAQVHAAAAIMGELVDSSAMTKLSVRDYHDRASDYMNALPEVDIWEIGNEVNGEWLGDSADVVAKLEGAYRTAAALGKPTALTLYYNEGCWADAGHEMFRWATDNLPDEVRRGVTYVLISYYEDDCNGRRPAWPAVFDRLADLFPTSKIGFGECGTKLASRKVDYVRRYYGMQISHTRYIGGYFWWYFADDMVPKRRRLWSVLNGAIRAAAATSRRGSQTYNRDPLPR